VSLVLCTSKHGSAENTRGKDTKENILTWAAISTENGQEDLTQRAMCTSKMSTQKLSLHCIGMVWLRWHDVPYTCPFEFVFCWGGGGVHDITRWLTYKVKIHIYISISIIPYPNHPVPYTLFHITFPFHFNKSPPFKSPYPSHLFLPARANPQPNPS
jgi:hypothetical protein